MEGAFPNGKPSEAAALSENEFPAGSTNGIGDNAFPQRQGIGKQQLFFDCVHI